MSIRIHQSIRRGDFALDINLELPATGTSALFGPNGSGKTSLLRAVAGLDHHPGGEVVVDGRPWQREAAFVPVHQRELAYVFQEDNLFGHLNVRDNIAYATRRAGIDETSAAEIVNLMETAPLMNRWPAELSGGERQKVAITRALALRPRLLLMDEPLASVDIGFRDRFLPRLRELLVDLGIPMLYVSHSPDEIAQLADTLVVLEPGCPAAVGSLANVLTSPGFGLANRQDAESVFEATVKDFDADYGLLQLAFAGGILQVSGPALPRGSTVRVRIQAQDVSVALSPPEQSSILNVYSAGIREIMPCGESRVTLLLELGDEPLLARITRKSLDQLGLQVGQRIHAQVKSVAVLGGQGL